MEAIEEFMESPLARWVELYEGVVEWGDQAPLYSRYMEVNSSRSARDRYLKLTNGIFLNEVMRLIDPNPKVEQLYRSDGDNLTLRVQNFSILNRHLRTYYQEDLQQLILMPLPNIAILGQDPLTEAAVEELRSLLLLLLGCAVQCENKETFIQQIQSLDIQTQAAIASCIQEVTQDPRVVLPLQWEELNGAEEVELQLVFTSMAKQVQGLLAQRDTHLERIAELCREREARAESGVAPLGAPGEEPPGGLALQLADSRAKLRRLKQQLEDKGDQLLDYKQEVQTMEEQLKKLQKENRSLQGEVRGMRVLRDELDCARERVGHAEQLQAELQSCRHKLRSLEPARMQLKEQQQLCATLQETKELLEEQLTEARARCSSLREQQRDNLLLRQRTSDLEAERDTERQRVDELLEMNMSLEAELKHSGRAMDQSEVESDEELRELIDLKPLSVEVGEASSLMLLGAERENSELRRRLEELQAQQEAKLPDVRGELSCLELEHQDTLRQLQNLKSENNALKCNLQELQQIEGVGEERGGEEEVGRGGERGVPGSESPGEKGEGAQRRLEEDGGETGGEILGGRREAGVGQEVLLPDEGQGGGVQAKDRGEAEGGQREKGRKRRLAEEGDPRREDDAIRDSKGGPLEEGRGGGGAEDGVGPSRSPSNPEVRLLMTRLQEVQEEAERQTLAAQDLRSKLGDQSRRAWEAEQRLVLLEAESQRMKKAVESLGEARRRIEVLQAEGLVMEEELCRLRSQAELWAIQATVITALEGERAALERDRDTLRSAVDALRTGQRKGDQLELTNQALRTELERQGRSLEGARRREEELEAELREAAAEAEASGRAREQARLEASQLEQEKEEGQAELEERKKEARQREREAARLRQQLESTARALEHGNQRARALDAEQRRLCQDLSQAKELYNQLRDTEKELGNRLENLEKDKRHLNEQISEAQSKISSLTQNVSEERARSGELLVEVTRLNLKLDKAEADLRTARDSLGRSQEKIESLSGFLKESNGLVRSGERKGSLGTATAPARVPENSSDPQPPPSLDTSPGLEVGDGHDLSRTQDDPAAEGERLLHNRLMELEKEHWLLVAEREALLSRASQAQEAGELLREQMEALRRHSLSLQESCTKLQTLHTQSQVEHASLTSQHVLVLARCSESEARCAALEAESKVWARERDESHARTETLRHDLERMTALQQRQEVELEEVLDRHSELRSSNRSLEGQHRELEARYKELLDARAQLEEREREIKIESEKMEGEAQRTMERERELERVKEDKERLQAQQQEWLTAQAEFLAQGSVLRAELSAAQLERTRLEGELSALRENNQSLDLSNVCLTSQYRLLTQLKGNMEEENRHLVEQNQSLLKENRSLLEQSLERRDQHHTQQREYQEKLSELRREKQKLVEKIMDQYRVLEPAGPSPASKAKKSNWIADRMKKLIKSRAGGGGAGGREGRALFTAAGSVENLANSTEYTPDAHTPQPDPLSAPVSPSPNRKEASAPGSPPAAHSGPRGRRKLGSRHGWGLGLGARGASGVSQSFSPGDQKTPPRLHLGSAQRSSSVPWEDTRGDKGVVREERSSVTSRGSVGEGGGGKGEGEGEEKVEEVEGVEERGEDS